MANVVLGGVPGADEAAVVEADEGIEHPALVEEGLDGVGGELEEDHVGLARVEEAEAGDGGQLGFEEGGHAVGVGGVAEPGLVLEHADPGGGEEPHFRGELAGLFAAVIELAGHVVVEEDDRLADGHPVLGTAEAEDIDAGLPGDFLGGDAEGGDGVGEAGAVHVEAQFMAAGDFPEGLDFVDGIDGAEFGSLGEADGAGFGVVDIVASADGLFDASGVEFAVGAGDEEDLGAVGEELWGAALVGFDMGHFVAEDAVVGLAGGGEGEGVGGGAVEDEEHFAIGFEEVAEEVGGLLGPGVVAVAMGVAGVGGEHGLPGLRADPGVVIAGELAGPVVGLHEGGGGNGQVAGVIRHRQRTVRCGRWVGGT